MSFQSIRFKIVAAVAVSLATAMVVLVLVLESSFRSQLRATSEQAIRTADASYRGMEGCDTAMLSSTLEALSANADLKRAFEAKDREQLQALAQPIFDVLKKKYRITHWYFHTTAEPQGTVFLRVHNPKLFGDPLARATYLASARTQDTAAGKELGKTAFALRVVRPYLDGERVIGFVELGEEIGHFLDAMKHKTGDDFAMVVSKEFLDRGAFDSVAKETGVRNTWDDFPSSVVLDATVPDADLFQLDRPLGDVPEGGLVLGNVRRDDRTLVRGVFPITDAAGRKVGGVFVLRDITTQVKQQEADRAEVLGAVFLFMTLLAVLLVWLVHRVVIRRLDRMIDTVTVLAGGDVHKAIVKTADDEVGRFEEQMERFRALYVNVLEEAERNVGPGEERKG